MTEVESRPTEEIEAASFCACGALNRAFTAALLLTGSVRQSEAAVLESIESADFGRGALAQVLLCGTIQAALVSRAANAELQPEQLKDASSLLPAELRRVLRLPAPARQCFTLRLLAGLTAKACARLLRFEVCQVDEAAILGAQMLAGMIESEDTWV